MSFDKDTRNLLAKTVAACRRRLVEDVTDQLRGVFGLHPDGVVLPLEKLTHLSPDQHAAARRLRDLLDHYTAGAAGKDSDRRKAAYERMVLEISFTALNRLAALRLCEERGLVVECVRKGTTSAGFQMFERISGGAIGGRYDTYRVFLECLFDEFALDLGVLFDRTTPQSAVFPSERCMEDVLAELNKPELTHLWTEDETIGWVYQYFNPPEERKAMRDASQAPRNSRELAVRNQFFTPRYVVEFLTDNTLGRIWYEMRKGDTVLKEECRYLVRRPNEVFLDPD
ncbi:MAG TPA: SAM-dependent methyltransferase, partial [Myxococcota bacterium]|nr:SAM-dependent methyltransferase [Myxococcota bacterium]